MAWREIIDGAYIVRSDGGTACPRYECGASQADLVRLATELGCTLPADLKNLLLESNGVMETLEIEGRVIENMWIVWPTSELPGENRHRRAGIEQPKPPEHLLVFAGAGADGILFAYNTKSPESGVVAWFPIEGEIRPLASSLSEFLVGWIGGEITV